MIKTKYEISFNSISIVIGLLIFIVFIQCHTAQDLKTNQYKQKGAHVFGYIDSLNIQSLKQNNFDWITIVPFASQDDYDTPTVNYSRRGRRALVRRDSMWKSKISIAHQFGFKVFLKPHIWLDDPRNNKWRSDIFPKDDNDWKIWQDSYREFILHYAEIAQINNVELFCIGTELTRLTIEKSEYWINLIQEVRSIYSGQITYAANWYEEYEKIKFWDQLDYIGIQAYFPLNKNKLPKVKQISDGWKKYLPQIASISKKFDKKILFTELGYKSTSDSAAKPWEWVELPNEQTKSVSNETQANCYQAFFDTVWEKEWMGGIHIWQWRSDFNKERWSYSLDFTPQGKPAVDVISKGFEMHK